MDDNSPFIHELPLKILKMMMFSIAMLSFRSFLAEGFTNTQNAQSYLSNRHSLRGNRLRQAHVNVTFSYLFEVWPLFHHQKVIGSEFGFLLTVV